MAQKPSTPRGAVGDVADLFGKADDLDLELRVFELLPEFLQQPVVGDVVELLAVAVELAQFRRDHGAGLVARHEGADEAALARGALDIGNNLRSQLLGGDRAGIDDGSARNPSSVISFT